MKDIDKILLGETLPLPESDQEDTSTDQLLDDASIKYDLMSLIDAIGTDRYKYVYFCVVSILETQPIEVLISFSDNIIDKIKIYYNFEFSKKFDINDKSTIDQLFRFVSFLEYDYVSFLATFWAPINSSILRSDIDKTISKLNLDEEIERSLKSNPQSEMISDFLRTNIKENLHSFIVDRTEKSRVEIAIEIIERGKKNA